MEKVRVGYMGPGKSTFGYQALQKKFSGNGDVDPVEFSSHTQVCVAVGSMNVDYGVVAIENVIDGVVAETIRAVESVNAHFGLRICGEVALPIKLYYMNNSGDGSVVKRLHVHPTAKGQCTNFVTSLRNSGIDIDDLMKSTTAGAQKAKDDPEGATLASRLALDEFGLKPICEESVTDYENSTTRFWILGEKHAQFQSGKKFKTCFLANLEQAASGVLHKTLSVFADNGISVLIVYPNPILGKRWEYTFVIEVSGHVSEPPMIKAWEDFRKLGISLLPLRFLGSYLDTTSEYTD